MEFFFLIFCLSLVFFLAMFLLFLASVFWLSARETAKACRQFRLRTLFWWTAAMAVYFALCANRKWLPSEINDPVVLAVAYVTLLGVIALVMLVVKDIRSDRVYVSRELEQRTGRPAGLPRRRRSSQKLPKLRLRSRKLKFWRPGGRIDV